MTTFDDRFADRVREVFGAYEEPVDEGALAAMRAALGAAAGPAPDRPAARPPEAARWARRGLPVLAVLVLAGALWGVLSPPAPPTGVDAAGTPPPNAVAQADPAAPPAPSDAPASPASGAPPEAAARSAAPPAEGRAVDRPARVTKLDAVITRVTDHYRAVSSHGQTARAVQLSQTAAPRHKHTAHAKIVSREYLDAIVTGIQAENLPLRIEIHIVREGPAPQSRRRLVVFRNLIATVETETTQLAQLHRMVVLISHGKHPVFAHGHAMRPIKHARGIAPRSKAAKPLAVGAVDITAL